MPTIEVPVPPEFQRLIANFGNVDVSPALGEWELATDLMFDLTQQYAHVVTGRMKGSGSGVTSLEGSSVVGTIDYTQDYTQFEIDRGGTHDFMGVAMPTGQAAFEEALLAAMDAIGKSLL